MYNASLSCLNNIISICGFSQIQRHQRLKFWVASTMCQNPIPVGTGISPRQHWWHQIGHYNRPAKMLGSIRHNRRQHRPVAQMKMPVIWPAQGQRCDRFNRSHILLHEFDLGQIGRPFP